MNQAYREEEEWVAALKEGNEKGFEQIYQKYWPKLFSAAYNHTRVKETAQEIVQEVFVSLWINRSNVTIHTNLQAYLLKAVRNKIYDYFDKQSVRSKYELFVSVQKSDAINFTEQEVIYTELNELVHTEINILPETTRQVFQLSRFNGFTIPEIAQEMQVSVKTVEYHLTKALKHLRLRLTELLSILAMMMFI